MLNSRIINHTERQFLNESLRYWNRFKKDLPYVMIPEILALYESAKKQGMTSIGYASIYWHDSRPTPKGSPDMTEYFSHDPECTSASPWSRY